MPFRVAIIGVLLAIHSAIRADPIDDVVQTVHARKLLYDDARLRDLNIGISVKNRIATLWGPAPSLELAQLAESRLRAVVEIREVRNELHVSPEARKND